MTPSVQVGTILIEQQPPVSPIPELESEHYSGNWGIVKALNGSAPDLKIHAAGWNFFFIAAEVRVKFLGSPSAERIQNALKRLLTRVGPQDFNCLEVTGIVTRRFLGVSYTVLSAHCRHIQQGFALDSAEQRRASRQKIPAVTS